MKRLFICAALLVAGALGASAQTKNGGISPEMLDRISKSYTGSAEQKAVKNALASNSIAALAINSENLAMIDTHFSHRVKTQGITDQKSSGRCWLFTGLNVLRAKMIDKHNLPGFEFSQNYNSFYDLLEKSNLFLQAIIDTRDLPMDDRKVDWLMKNPIVKPYYEVWRCTQVGYARDLSEQQHQQYGYDFEVEAPRVCFGVARDEACTDRSAQGGYAQRDLPHLG